MAGCDIADSRKTTKIMHEVAHSMPHIKYNLAVMVVGAVKTRYSATVFSPRFVAANGNAV